MSLASFPNALMLTWIQYLYLFFGAPYSTTLLFCKSITYVHLFPLTFGFEKSADVLVWIQPWPGYPPSCFESLYVYLVVI